MAHQTPQAGRTNLRRLGVLVATLGFGLTIVLFLVSPRGVGAREEPYLESTTTTAAGGEPAIDPNAPELGPLEQPEVVDMAEQLGITREEAVANFEEQDRRLSFVEGVNDHPDFVDYRGPSSANGELFGGEDAVMVVEPGSEDASVFRSGPPEIEVQAATLPADARERALSEVEEVASARLRAAYEGVSYDVFDNSYTIWVRRGTLDGSEGSKAVDWRMEENPSADVFVEELVDLVPTWGGAYANNSNGTHLCTNPEARVDVVGYVMPEVRVPEDSGALEPGMTTAPPTSIAP